MSDERPPFDLRIERWSGSPGAGVLAFLNRSDRVARVWRSGNSWGDAALSFELSSHGAVVRFLHRPEAYTRNVPAPIEIEAGRALNIAFDLGGGEWIADGSLETVAGPDAALMAVYAVDDTPEARTMDVWIGRLRSQPFRRGR